MKSFHSIGLLAPGILLLAACSKPTAPADSLPGQASAPVPAVTTPAEAGIGNGTTELADFTVDPGQVFNCDGRDRATSKVKWSVKDPSIATVKILVSDGTSSDKQTFAAGANIGEAMTGNWVGANTHFFLVDGASNRELATYKVGVLPCT